MKNLFTIIMLGVNILFFAQKKDYKPLNDDKEMNVSYSFDKYINGGFFCWLKISYTEKFDPAVESLESYVEFKCSNKTQSDHILINNWRKVKPEIYTEKSPFREVSEDNLSYPLFEKYCK